LGWAGKPLPDRHGAPLRLIDPSRYGYKSAKLITSIQFVPEGKGSMARFSIVFRFKEQTIIIAESVYAAFEAKQSINASHVPYAHLAVIFG
jgi:DMSO/TMAO reductase YedYZ molybdopterin-dependent catalytic subunit